MCINTQVQHRLEAMTKFDCRIKELRFSFCICTSSHIAQESYSRGIEWMRGTGMTISVRSWILTFGLQHLGHPRKAMSKVLDIAWARPG
ncbi:hypothetical protein Taro_045498 [Colocasia esculenta]|uniref:Uncharacterized protein n=1 Tax=Colocasia esculenta TaxID=4460 RepID=A0A843WRG6_COLES|nr:hypothetical protein [Colocasia esculenta]